MCSLVAPRVRFGPIELGRRLVREMDDNRSVDVKGRRIVPNDFTIVLSQADRDGFGDIEATLTTELAEAAKEYAREEGYHFMGPVTVRLSAETTMKNGRFNVIIRCSSRVPAGRRWRRSCCRPGSGSA